MQFEIQSLVYQFSKSFQMQLTLAINEKKVIPKSHEGFRFIQPAIFQDAYRLCPEART